MKVTIQGKEIDLELTDEQKAVVERALRPQTGWERANQEYFFILDNNKEQSYEGHSRCNDDDYNNANYFNNKELIKNIIRAQTLQRKLWRRSAELCKKGNWSSWCCIYYDYEEHKFSTYSGDYIRDFGQVYFDTEEHAKQVIEEFRDELTWYFTEFKSKMD